MLRDVFYFGKKPNVHPRELLASSLDDARQLSTTEHFWVINEFCDYNNFDWDWDFEFLPDEDVWASEHNNVWPSLHQKDSGTWLCYTDSTSGVIIYRADVDPLIRKNEISANWHLKEKVDQTTIDFSWHPDPTDPPYIYKWGCKYFPVELMNCLEYVVDGATDIKYMRNIVELLPSECMIETQPVDKSKFDMSWRPDPLEPPFIYVWGNKYIDGKLQSTLEYHAPRATEKKYMHELVDVLPQWDRWSILQNVDKNKFDFSWRPDPLEPPFIYVWGNKYIDGKLQSTLEYTAPHASEIKYMDELVDVLPQWDRWSILQNVDKSSFDFSWRPDPLEPPFIYVWGNNQYPAEVMPTVEYIALGATDRKYMNGSVVKLSSDMTNWIIPDTIDKSSFDFSWHPNPNDPAYIYQFGTQWQKTGGPRYVVDGATEVKYISTTRSTVKADSAKFYTNYEVDSFDYSWHPDETEEPYIYVFGNTQHSAKVMPTVEYRVEGATKVKYISDIVATLAPSRDKWFIPNGMTIIEFDFSWHPNPNDPAYIYQFGTQWQTTSGPRYVVEGATDIKYIDTNIAKIKADKTKWHIPDDIELSSFDFSWHPHPADPAYIYQFGTQWQKTGGPRYVVEGAIDIKYMDLQVSTKKPNMKNWVVPDNVSNDGFDFSWHPDETEEPYNYVFPTKWQSEGGPIYQEPGAMSSKYMATPVAATQSQQDKWDIPDNVSVDDFDFSWHPHPKESAYIYQFGTQWQKTCGPRYVVEGATEVKYMDLFTALHLPSEVNWVIPNNVNLASFDFSWHPDDTEEPYLYQFGTQWSKLGGPQYVIAGATEIKYVDTIRAKIKADKTKWQVPNTIDESSFDFSWQPDIEDQPYIYQFGTQWQKTGGPRYVVEGATEVKYIDAKATRLPDKSNWNILIPVDAFDYSWHPDETEEPYIYVFGNQWNDAIKEPTVEYRVEGATQRKYIQSIVATVSSDKSKWNIITAIEDFDFSWRPDPTDPAFIYVFGNTQFPGTVMPTVELRQAGAQQQKYIHDITATLAQNPLLFTNTELVKEFDYSWRPDPTELPYIYQFGTQWQKTDGPRYVVEGATEIKYIASPLAKVAPDMTHWEIPADTDVSKFDFSWHPDATSPPYVYQFGTILDENNGPRYVTPDNNGIVVNMERTEIVIEELDLPRYLIKTTLEDLINEHAGEIFWAIQQNINYDSFNFKWAPNKKNVYHVNVFGSPESITTQTYFVNGKMWQRGYREFNYLEDVKLDDMNLGAMFKKFDIFMIDKGNPEAQERFEQLTARFGNVQKTRYLNTWVDTINRCINRSTTELCWIVNSELDYTNFDFEFYPNPWQMKMLHVFGTQWSHWGTTFVVNTTTFANDTRYVKIIEHLSNINFVKNKTALATNCVHDIVVIDHANPELSTVMQTISAKAFDKSIVTVKFEESYLTTFKKMLEKLPVKKDHYMWITSSVCDYSSFDFSYICDPYAKDQLHVFPSNKQKFGDTFFVDVEKLRTLISDMTLLEDFKKINFNQHQRVSRLPAPHFTTYEDTHFKNARQVFNFPYAILTTEDNSNVSVTDDEPMNLWSLETKNIIITSAGGTRIIVPDEVKNYVKKELYDYPYIKSNSRLATSSPMDIVFLSNGETGADKNYAHLLKVTKGLPNRVVRVDGINGRVAAYHAAAQASNTPWMFTVFAKLQVDIKFNWNWQPDRLQIPKHYIFNATNPVNGLIYGHQGMIAYNKRLTLANEGKGLDFTMDDEHEVVELHSGVAVYNTDAWSTWRTAFRESLKLCNDTTDIGKTRLAAWVNKAEGAYAKFSIKGATDAVQYFDEVHGDIEKLRLSYEWEWLRTRFDS